MLGWEPRAALWGGIRLWKGSTGWSSPGQQGTEDPSSLSASARGPGTCVPLLNQALTCWDEKGTRFRVDARSSWALSSEQTLHSPGAALQTPSCPSQHLCFISCLQVLPGPEAKLRSLTREDRFIPSPAETNGDALLTPHLLPHYSWDAGAEGAVNPC